MTDDAHARHVEAISGLAREEDVAEVMRRAGYKMPPPRSPLRRDARARLARRHRDAGKAAYLAEFNPDERPSVDRLYIGPFNAVDDIAERLGVRPGTQVLARTRRYLLDDIPTQLATSYIPWEIAKGTAMIDDDTGPGGIYARLEEQGHTLHHFTEQTAVRMPTGDEIEELELRDDKTPVFEIGRVAYDGNGLAVEVCDAVLAGDLWVLVDEFPAT